MKQIIQYAAGVLLLIVVLMAITFGLGLFGLEFKKFFAPKYEEVRREVFEETKSYNEGKAMEFEKLRLEYLREKDPAGKTALAHALLHKLADYDKTKLSLEQQRFLKKLEQQTINY